MDKGSSQGAERHLVALLDDPDFQELSAGENAFNIFDALGTRRQELRHSDFLAYMLDPARPHGLGDQLLRDFLCRVAKDAEIGELPEFFQPLSVRLNSLNSAEVYRERHHFDLLIQFPNQGIVVIENKIGAGEGDTQLFDYAQKASMLYPNEQALLIFLTPQGLTASDRAHNWQSISYQLIHQITMSWASNEGTPLRTRHALQDYANFLEGHVLETSKEAELCRKIYRQHKQAIDLLLEHIPSLKDSYLEIAQRVVDELEVEGLLVKDDVFNRVNRFIPADVEVPRVRSDKSWTKSGRGILFEWIIKRDSLFLNIVVGPIDKADRNAILDHFKSQEVIARVQQEFQSAVFSTRATQSWQHVIQLPITNFDNSFLEETEADQLAQEMKIKVQNAIALFVELQTV